MPPHIHAGACMRTPVHDWTCAMGTCVRGLGCCYF